MEDQQRTGTDGGQKAWLIGFQWSFEGMSLDEAREKADVIADYATSIGVNRVAGSVGLAREREPVESFEFGSDEPYRNRHAITGHSSVADAIASGAGARQTA